MERNPDSLVVARLHEAIADACRAAEARAGYPCWGAECSRKTHDAVLRRCLAAGEDPETARRRARLYWELNARGHYLKDRRWAPLTEAVAETVGRADAPEPDEHAPQRLYEFLVLVRGERREKAAAFALTEVFGFPAAEAARRIQRWLGVRCDAVLVRKWAQRVRDAHREAMAAWAWETGLV